VNVPVKIPDLNNIVDISAGFWHSLVIKANGGTYSFGRNNFGQLGLGHNTSPVNVTT
jgi:alpha-tubulin suppressor-like RCC1 family protein